MKNASFFLIGAAILAGAVTSGFSGTALPSQGLENYDIRSDTGPGGAGVAAYCEMAAAATNPRALATARQLLASRSNLLSRIAGSATPTPPSTPTPTPPPLPAQALNISTRLRVETADSVMIGGFIIQGNVSMPVVLRAIGPSLAGSGIPVATLLADPVLELRGPDGALIMRNDNWKDDQRSLIEGTPFQPTDDRESVIVATLQPAAYTAIVTGKSETTGVGLVEVYDTNQAFDARLANISTRGIVQTGDNVMIGGFILGGESGDAVLVVRGLGPSLAQLGLSAVADPTLELHDGNGAVLVSNDDWQDDPTSASGLSFLGLAPEDPKESGIFLSLPPGPFTTILAGKNGGTGIGLVEIYNVLFPPPFKTVIQIKLDKETYSH